MSIPLKLTCSAKQACHYSTFGRTRFGYVNALCIDNQTLTPDVLVAEPLSDERSKRPAAAALFSKPAVGVLERVHWSSGRPADSIRIEFLVSAKNGAILEMLFRSQEERSEVRSEFALVVYDWDYQQDSYYVRFCTNQGAGSGSSAPAGFGSDARAAGKALAAILDDGSVEEEPVDDELLGAIMFRAELTLMPPPEVMQSFLIATSQKAKAMLPWGEVAEERGAKGNV